MNRGRRVLAAGLAMLLSGCATLMTEKSQTVRLSTVPPGNSLYYQGSRVNDGDYVKVRRDYRTPAFELGPEEEPLTTDMEYSVEPWVIGDAGLAVFFIIPGVIAGGLDVATGAWRKLEPTQVVDVKAARAVALQKQEEKRKKKPEQDTDSESSDVKRASPEVKQEGAPPTGGSSQPSEATRPAAPPPTPSSSLGSPRDSAARSIDDYKPEEGIVSWYDPGEGHATASGESFDPGAMTAAHRTLPFGTRVRVTRLDTNYSVVVTVNDRGPEVQGRIIDLARRPAEMLGLPDVGIAPCRVEVVSLPGR